MSGTSESSSRDPETYRINGLLLIRVLLVISRGCNTRKELRAATGLCQGSVTRLLRVARIQFGMEITFRREEGYVIEDWGVFNPEVFQGVASSTASEHTP